ncbi:MAG: hypothetical protein RSE07_05525 [Oscillospiraceae bacterium]
MKKSTSIILASIILILSILYSCKKNLVESTLNENEINQIKNVSIYTEKEEYTISDTSIKIVVDNNSSDKKYWGKDDFIVQIEKKNKWMTIPFKENNTLINLEDLAFKIKPGKYRIVLFLINGEPLAASFVIKD